MIYFGDKERESDVSKIAKRQCGLRSLHIKAIFADPNDAPITITSDHKSVLK